MASMGSSPFWNTGTIKPESLVGKIQIVDQLKRGYSLSLTEIEKFKQYLKTKFVIKDLGKLEYFLGIEPNIALSSKPSNTNPKLKNITKYQKLIGKLIYLTTTRPDIAYIISCLSKFMHNSLKSHLYTALKVISYLKGSPSKGLNIVKSYASGIEFKAYSDADWARFVVTRSETPLSRFDPKH
ncbi:ribonuclease H-like domain-containing protein [Tanacetum coccineum]